VIRKISIVIYFFLFLVSCSKDSSKTLETKLNQSNTITFLLTGISEEQKLIYCVFVFLLPEQKKLGLFYINPLTTLKESTLENLGEKANLYLIPYLESITNLKINYSLWISQKDFSKIIDLLGGVNFYIDPTLPLKSETYKRNLGENLMFGEEVVDFLSLQEGEILDTYIDRQNLQQSIFLSLYDRLKSIGELKKEWVYFFASAFHSTLSPQDLYALYQYILKNHILISTSELPVEVIVDSASKQTKLLAKNESAKLAFEKLVRFLNSGDYGYGELARTEVLNSTDKNGLARKVKSILNEKGFKVLSVGNGWNPTESKSIVIDRSGNPEITYKIAKTLEITNVYHIIDKELGLDTTVLLGEDFETKNHK
jgi:anionic cell wall polymer biosynthesis LytR-Cps2A-Psr (LCP) family protein